MENVYFGANVAYSQSHTTKTLTSGGLYGSSGNGALQRVYGFGTSDDMGHYLNEDGTRFRMFDQRLDPWDESDNPYWIINKNQIKDKTTRFTGSFNIKADITDWWWINFRMGTDTYTTEYQKRMAAGGVLKREWQDGMMSDNTTKYEYINTNFMMNFNKTFGDFGTNLLIGTSTDNTHSRYDKRMAWNFQVPDFFSYNNTDNDHKKFEYTESRKRLVGVYGELRLDWQNTLFLTVTGRNDWTSTLPKENRSYFYPSYSGAVVFTEFLQRRGLLSNDSPLTFGKVRVSWAKVGKDTSPYETATSLWPVGTYLGNMVSLGNNWTRGNPYLKPEMTKSTEVGLELRFFQNRLKLDYAYYTNDSYNQILSPRGPQSTGYIFCSYNAGNVLNKGMELSISGTPIETKDWTWETGINIAGNRGKLEGLLPGMDIMYVTDVQYSSAKAASFSGGSFMAIAGNKWQTVKAVKPQQKDYMENGALNQAKFDAAMATYEKLLPHNGKTIFGKDAMPLTDGTTYQVGNREPKFQGGWNNTLRYKNLTFNMLWEFSVGGDVYNGTALYMMSAGTSLKSAQVRNEPLTVSGVIDGKEGDVIHFPDGTTQKLDADAKVPYSATINPNEPFILPNGTTKLGYNVIKDYYTGAYANNSANYITKVNSLRLRTISLTYDVPKSFIAKTKVFKRASVTASATNLLLFTNYDGDPEVAASGAGAGGSSSVGFDYCGVPSTASFAFGVNLTF